MTSTSSSSSPSSSGYSTLPKNANKTVGKANSVFGSATTMSKEDYDRDRARWQQKLAETTKRLADAETVNSEMNQIKAELNKKIVEMERNQKPLIERNRRLSDRNRILQSEIKKYEQKLCHSQDDFLTLRDEYERLMKDNQSLRERRALPEKLEELDRYRNQVLEYSKCVTALRQAGLEKDRRYDLLAQKFRRLRKCISLRKSGENDDDRQSSFGGSDCSAESSISLNTITEDLNEALDKDIENGYQQLAREREELQRTLSVLKTTEFAFEDEQILRDQLFCAQATIAQQQMVIERHNMQSDSTAELMETITRLQDEVIMLRQKNDCLQAELYESKDMTDLLEFQLLESNESMKHENELAQRESKQTCDVSLATDEWVSDEDDCALLSQIPINMDYTDISSRKCAMINMRRSANLSLDQRELVQHSVVYMDHLENDIMRLRTEMESKIKNSKEKEVADQQKIQELEELAMKSYSKQKKKKELQIEVEVLRHQNQELEIKKKTLCQEVNTLSKEMGKLRYMLQQKDEALSLQRHESAECISRLEKQSSIWMKDNQDLKLEMQKMLETLDRLKDALKKKQDEAEQMYTENAKLQTKYSESLKEIEQLKDDLRPTIKTDLERRFEEHRYRLSCALETINQNNNEMSRMQSRIEELESKLAQSVDHSSLAEELEQIREYTAQLEQQFAAQVNIIDALKRKVVQQKALTDFVSNITENGDVSVTKIGDKLEKFRLSHSDDGNCQLMEALQKLLKLAASSALGFDVLPSSLS